MSVHMEEVTLRVAHFGEYERVFLDWDEVDAILARSQFSNLRRVDISPVRWSVSWSSTQFISRLPLCHARGILRIRELDHKRVFL